MTEDASKYPCVCCGHLTLHSPPGSFELCEVCFWEDDSLQLRWPTMRGGANGPSLIEAQANYAAIGAMEEQFVHQVRLARDDEPREEGWRRIDLSTDRFEPEHEITAFATRDDTDLYWWRPTFWRS